MTASAPIILGPLPMTPDRSEFEIVERKGRGHPDTIFRGVYQRAPES